MIRFLSILCLLCTLVIPIQLSAQGTEIPSLPREFRGVWVTTYLNLDWPSGKGLSTQQQKAELTAMLNKAQAMNLNAIMFQVRPAGDAVYDSKIEPWSACLTGKMGKAPDPYYDPLEFVIEEAHKRGLELHAWINPYRALSAGNQDVAANHISKKRPDLMLRTDKWTVLNPGEPESTDYILTVVTDIVRRYDVDGIQYDDYFYPEPPFDDSASYQKYKGKGGTLALADWRRDNVNQMVRRSYEEVKKLRPHVKFGISPCGIWKNGVPDGIRGKSGYDELYGDSAKWLREGWVDYLSPQLYWKIDPPQTSFPVLLDWWLQQNPKSRYVWPGIATYKIDGTSTGYPAAEIINQIQLTHKRPPAARGHIHFRYNWLRDDKGGVSTALKDVYRGKALVPPLTWIDSTPPSAPRVMLQPGQSNQPGTLRWQGGGNEPVKNWIVYAQMGDKWWVEVLPAKQTALTLKSALPTGIMAVSAVDLAGNESPRAVLGTKLGG